MPNGVAVVEVVELLIRVQIMRGRQMARQQMWRSHWGHYLRGGAMPFLPAAAVPPLLAFLLALPPALGAAAFGAFLAAPAPAGLPCVLAWLSVLRRAELAPEARPPAAAAGAAGTASAGSSAIGGSRQTAGGSWLPSSVNTTASPPSVAAAGVLEPSAERPADAGDEGG